MTGVPRTSSVSTGRSVDRLVNFTDAVVAVAVTLLALPLVDIPGPGRGGTVWTVMGDHASEISTFLFTFYVVAVMWAAHNRILNGIRGYDGFLFWVNTTWLAAIVLLPWFSAMFGESAEGRATVGLVYWGALALISILSSLMGWHLQRSPGLCTDAHAAAPPPDRRAALRGPVFAGYFLAIGVVSLFWPEVASWMPFGIIPLSIWFRPARPGEPEPVGSQTVEPHTRETP